MKHLSGHPQWRWAILITLVLVLFQACQFMPQTDETQDQAETMVAWTMEAIALQMTLTQLATEIEGVSQAEQETPEPPEVEEQEPTATLTPTVELTATRSVPVVTVSRSTNCRTGPGTDYDRVGALAVGQEAEVIARNADSSYWIIRNPSRAGDCWLWGFYATVEGPTANLPVWEPPPTPTPPVTAHRSGTLELQENWGADLDQGATGFWATTDFVFYVVLADEYFEPVNGARFLRWGGTEPTYHECSTAALVTAEIPLSQLGTGIYFCYQTTGGRYGRFRVTGLTNPPGRVLTISFTTWNIP